MSDRFKNKPKAKKLCSRINSLREWLHKGDGLGMQFIIDNYIDSLGVKEPLTNKEKDYIKKGYEYLKQTSYSQSYIDWILKRDFETTDINQVLDQVRLVFEDDEYHFVNKLNTNYSDLAELITQMFIKVDDSKEMYTTAFGERGIADVSDEELKEGLLRVKDRFEGILNDKFTFDDIKTYVNNSKRNSDFGDSGENIVANFLKDQDFDVVFQGGDGNFIDMKFGVDLIVYKDGRFYSIQVKPNNPNKWLSSKRYKNVDWIVTYVGGVNIFANKKGVVNGEEYQSGGINNITSYVKEKKSMIGDDLIETFIDTGKMKLREIDDPNLDKLKSKFVEIGGKTIEDLLEEKDVYNILDVDIINDIKNTYQRQKNTYVYDRKWKKVDSATYNQLWLEIIDFFKNIYILNLYSKTGNIISDLSRGQRKRESATLLGITSALSSLIDRYNDLDTLKTQLKNINNFIRSIDTTNEGYITSLRNDLWDIIINISEDTNIKEILEKTQTSYMEYENSFLGKGFYKEKKSKEGRIHDLKGGVFNSKLTSDEEVENIFNYIKSNIENYVTNIDNIEKYDVISDRDFYYVEGEEEINLISSGDKIEVKKNKYGTTHDSYYSEPLASPVKVSNSPIKNNPKLLDRYNGVIDKLYDWLNNEGSDIANQIIKKIVKGTKGIFLDDYIFIPIQNIEFYLSNKGQNNCQDHRRLVVRYRLKYNKPIYKLIDGENLFVKVPYGSETSIEKKYVNCSGNVPKIIYDGADSINESIENFFDTGKLL